MAPARKRPASGETTARGEILGVGSSSAAVPLNAWPDSAEPLVRTMRLALDDAAIEPGDVDVVYASANATRSLDEVESEALAALFGFGNTVVTSLKGALGESGASGSAACVAALLCGRAGRVPPISGLARPDACARPLQLATTSVAAAWADRARQQLRERRRPVQRCAALCDLKIKVG